MKKVTLNKNYFNELKKLMKYASRTLTNVSVAAIIVTDKGIFKGVNYEDIVCSLSICAERNAIYNGITNGMSEIYEIHLITSRNDLTMCGACRQLASSFTTDKANVFVYHTKTGKCTKTPFKRLLPFE